MNKQFETPFFNQVITENCESLAVDLFQEVLLDKFFVAILCAKHPYSAENSITLKLYESDDGSSFFEKTDFSFVVDSANKAGLTKIEIRPLHRFLKAVFEVSGSVSARLAVSFQKT